jgi:hypothetical protein
MSANALFSVSEHVVGELGSSAMHVEDYTITVKCILPHDKVEQFLRRYPQADALRGIGNMVNGVVVKLRFTPTREQIRGYIDWRDQLLFDLLMSDKLVDGEVG